LDWLSTAKGALLRPISAKSREIAFSWHTSSEFEGCLPGRSIKCHNEVVKEFFLAKQKGDFAPGEAHRDSKPPLDLRYEKVHGVYPSLDGTDFPPGYAPQGYGLTVFPSLPQLSEEIVRGHGKVGTAVHQKVSW